MDVRDTTATTNQLVNMSVPGPGYVEHPHVPREIAVPIPTHVPYRTTDENYNTTLALRSQGMSEGPARTSTRSDPVFSYIH